MPFAELERDRRGALNIVPNDWAIAQTRLRDRGISLALAEP